MWQSIEVISSIFSDHNAVRLDANYRKKEKLSTKELMLLNCGVGEDT